MAQKEQLFDFAREVIDVPVSEELGDSFLAYSLSVITSRAIPDIKDGLKPVQRRILYSMREMRLYPERPHRKCAHVVGNVMAKYHPHGDAAIYDTLVRMGQDFSRQITLVDPQGNFGSLDDPPAAYRYTECRLTEAALDLLGEIDEETVEWRATYDGETMEPAYLPALLPNLLVNGTSGIAVGMATSMASHNLIECFEAIKLVMAKRRPKPTTAQLMKVVPGPDFPTGGLIIDSGIAEAFETGKGSIRVRAKAEITKLTRARQGIEITELPYLVGAERVISKLKALRDTGKITEVSDVKNLSDRKSGLKILIECKTNVNPQALLEKLYKLTPLEETFSVNNVVLVDGVPTTVGLYELCDAYIKHRLDVIVKRSQYRLKTAENRLHLIEGLIIAIDNIDRVVAIIRGSENSASARTSLMDELDLTEVQAEYILELKLRRLTALAYDELVLEADELKLKIADLKKLLKSEARRKTLVISELGAVVERYGVPRRSQIVSADTIATEDEIEEAQLATITDTDCVVSLTASGLIGREPLGRSQNHSNSKHDVILKALTTSTAKYVYGITSKGRMLRCLANDIAEVGGRSRGKDANSTFGCARGEDVVGIFTGAESSILLASTSGRAKLLEASTLIELSSGKAVIKMETTETLVAATEATAGHDLVMVTADAQVLRTTVDQISTQGPGARGVQAMKLKGKATLVGAFAFDASNDTAIVVTTDVGTAKSTNIDELPTKNRGGSGIRLTKFGSEKRLTSAWVGASENALCIVSQEDNLTKADSKPGPLKLRPTKRDAKCSTPARRILSIGTRRW